MRRYAPFLVMLGMMLGPGYFIFCTYLSGEPGQTYTLTERAARWTLSDGTILRFARGQAYRPVDVQLSPDMNRIKLAVTFETAADGASQGADDYLATLMQADQPILHRTLQLQARPASSKTLSLGTLDVYHPGAYLFILETPQAPQVPVSRVVLKVEQHAETLSMPVLLCGLMLLAAGAALYLEPYLRFRR